MGREYRSKEEVGFCAEGCCCLSCQATAQDLQTARSFWHLYRPEDAPYRFKAGNLGEAVHWQAETRDLLARTVGFQDLPTVPLAPKLLERVDKGDYIREKVLLRTGEAALMPVYLLIPKGEPPFPGILAFHGHGYGVKEIVGLWEDGAERGTPEGYQRDFAVALCRKGFAVAAPEIACFGERRTDFAYLDTVLGQPVPNSCHHAAALAFHLGGSVIGLRVHDARRLVDYLETRAEFAAGRLGAMGISGGGMLTFYATCLDTRIKASAISGYYSTYRESILAMHHCPCNYVPGLYRFGEMYDLVGLIAPRPLLVEAGDHDPIFPIEAVKRSVDKARSVYGVFGAGDKLEIDYFEGRHRISGRAAYEFLWGALASQPQERIQTEIGSGDLPGPCPRLYRGVAAYAPEKEAIGSKIYFAGPLFCESERAFNQNLAGQLEEAGFAVFLPQRDGVESSKPPYTLMSPDERRKAVFAMDRDEITACDIFLFVLDGRIPDEGACVELGLAYMHRLMAKRPRLIIGLQTDCRAAFIGSRLNPMLRLAFDTIVETREALLEALTAWRENVRIGEAPAADAR